MSPTLHCLGHKSKTSTEYYFQLKREDKHNFIYWEKKS